MKIEVKKDISFYLELSEQEMHAITYHIGGSSVEDMEDHIADCESSKKYCPYELANTLVGLYNGLADSIESN